MKEMKENLEYMLNQIQYDIDYEVDNLTDDLYFEMSAHEIRDSFNQILLSLKKWQNYLEQNNINNIKSEYKNLEMKISQLELCLADKEKNFKLNGISYSLFEIGKKLTEEVN